jgi:hypothetical protein
MELTKESVCRLLQLNDRAVERAILVLFDRQTRDERRDSLSKYRNFAGFSAAHVSKGSYYARWIKSGRHLTCWHLENARRITQRYTKQLLLVAQEKRFRANLGAREEVPQLPTRTEVVAAVMDRAREARNRSEGGYRRVQERA